MVCRIPLFESFKYNGGKWYYVQKKVRKSYTGLSVFTMELGIILQGVLDWNYTGLCLYGGTWYYVKKVQLTGIIQDFVCIVEPGFM